MPRQYGNKARTKADKRAAALQFITWSDKSDAEKVQSLVASYGFREAEAYKFIREQRRKASGFGVSL